MVASRKVRFYPSALMLFLVRFFVRLYKCTLSPLLSLLGGPGSGCRFEPTCSAYFLEAVEIHGFACGSWLGLKRLARCQPWGGSGHDPVPMPRALAPTLFLRERGTTKSPGEEIDRPLNLDCVCE